MKKNVHKTIIKNLLKATELAKKATLAELETNEEKETAKRIFNAVEKQNKKTEV